MVVAVLVCAILGIVLGTRMSETTTELAAQQALIAARFTASSVDVGELAELKVGDDSTELYQEMVQKLEHARMEAGAKYSYVLVTDGTDVYYRMESAQEEPIGSLFEEELDSLMDAFNGQEILDPTIYHTDHGALISCYVPLFDQNGAVAAILGCDYDAQSIANMDRTNRLLVLFSVLFSVVFIAAVTLISISRILRPMKSASLIADKMQNCDLSQTENSIVSNDEIGDMSHAFSAVADNLREIIRDIHYQLDEMRNGNYCVESRCPESY